MIELGAEVAEALAAGGAGRRARVDDHRPRAPAPRQRAGRARARGTRSAPTAPRPATIAMLDGIVRIGLDDAALDAIATRDDVAKCSARDLPLAAARGASGATTVAATAHLAAQAGIACSPPAGSAACTARRSETWDESADLVALSRTGHLRRLRGREVDPRRRRPRSSGSRRSGSASPATAPTASPASTSPTPATPCRGGSTRRRRSPPRSAPAAELGLDGARSSSPTRCDEQLDPALHERVLAEALAAAEREGVRGPRRHPVPARALPRRDRRREPARQRAPRAAQRASSPRRSRRRCEPHDRHRRRRPDGRRRRVGVGAARPRLRHARADHPPPGRRRRQRRGAARRPRPCRCCSSRAPATTPRAASSIEGLTRHGVDARGRDRPGARHRHRRRDRRARRRAHDAPRPRRERRARARATSRSTSSPRARTSTSPATCCSTPTRAPAGARRARARARGGDVDLGRPGLGRAAAGRRGRARSSSWARHAGAAAAQRRGGRRC